jgi:SdrD B-like domain/Secretion system C-terminal sorting domain
MKIIHSSGIKQGFIALLLLSCIRCAGAGIPVFNTFSNGTVGDRVWLDRDADGMQGPGEVGFAGMIVLLLDENGNQVSSTVTDAGGAYHFTDIDAGINGKSYEVWFKVPDNYRFARRTGALADGQNSDADELSGKSGLFLLLPGQHIATLDAGVISPSFGALPLHTLDLTAELKSGKVYLKWLAENEMNTERFVIQQSTDGINFTSIGISAISGAINIPTWYNYTADINSLAGHKIIYFRIRAEDLVNRAAYSNVIPVRLDKVNGIRVWPNPFISTVRISYYGTNNSSLEVQLTDLSGREIRKRAFEITHGMNQLSLDGLGVLRPGTYFLRITDLATGQSFLEKLLR